MSVLCQNLDLGNRSRTERPDASREKCTGAQKNCKFSMGLKPKW